MTSRTTCGIVASWLIFLAMRPPIFPSPIVRLSRRLDPAAEGGAPIGAVRPRGSRRPHTDATILRVRRLIEETTLTYEQIAARTGASPASISRWMQDGSWERPAFAARAPDSALTPRASVYRKHRMLSRRLTALAERYVGELEEAPAIDLDKLGQALELLKIAKLAAMRRTPRRVEAAMWGEPMRPIAELCAVGVDLHRAPRAAIEDFLENRAMPPAEERPPRIGGCWRGSE